jgi:hypothetical protein
MIHEEYGSMNVSSSIHLLFEREHRSIFCWLVIKIVSFTSYVFYDAHSIVYLSCQVKGLKLLYWDIIELLNWSSSL